MAIAHLLSTQISLWLLSNNAKQNNLQKEHFCDFELDLGILKMFLLNNHNDSLFALKNSTTANVISEFITPEPFQIGLFVLNNQFKFLSVFILITMWFANNQSKINFIRAKLSEEEVIRSAYLNPESKFYMFRGFLVGSIFLLTAIIAIIFYNNQTIQYIAAIFIQVILIPI